MSYFTRRAAAPIKVPHPSTGKLVTVNPQKDAMIGQHPGSISRDLRRLPGLIAWYRQLRDNAKAELREAKHYEHNVTEDLDAEYRAKRNGKKTSETELKMAIRADQRMRNAFRRRMDAERLYDQLSSAVANIEDKRWSLQSLAKLTLAEYGVSDSV